MAKTLIGKSKREINPLLVDIEKLKFNCDSKQFKFKSTAELESLHEIVGQKRAVEAIRLGALLNAKGYNIFVTGLSGTGRTSTVKKILDKISNSCPILYDYCYVNNFEDQDRPILIKLLKGKGKVLAKEMNDVITFLRRRLPMLFEEESYQLKRKALIDNFQNKERSLLQQFDEKIKPLGFIRGQLEGENGVLQPEVFPLVDNKPVSIEKISELGGEGKITIEEVQRLMDLWKVFHDELFDLAKSGFKLMQEFRKELMHSDRTAAKTVVDSAFDSISNDMNGYEKLNIYFQKVREFILDNLNLFVNLGNNEVPNTDIDEEKVRPEQFSIFSINVILDNSDTNEAPIIIETNPTYSNLFGSIEKVYDQKGFWRTDFTKIKAGSLLSADQGFLIVNANDLFQEPAVWNILKRVLLYNKLDIQPSDTYFQISQSSIKPEPIDVSMKVIIIGGQSLYKYLLSVEKGFKKIFKINAQFDFETEVNDEMLQNYTKFISMICKTENLPHCSPSGVAAVIEWAVEHSGSQHKISLKFSDVADVLREAAFYDRESSKFLIERKDVEKALQFRRFRGNMMDEKLKAMIIDGTMLIDTDGYKVGQINGLTIYDDGTLSFGKPAKITANISAGTNGIINIEREADMSGKIHNKGILIITGFLREKFAQKKPLTLAASIAFEQNYGGIDGDSASAAEIYVLLSAMAEIPISQSLAVTGSMNQKGDIQPIGGVNDKIKGYYEICKQRGFNGEHGVIIPKQNVKDLNLPSDLIEDVKKGNFRIYAISRIEDGIKLFFNIEPGDLDSKGRYPIESLFGKTMERIERLAAALKRIRNIENSNNLGNRSE